jgi:parvulin-like peptidyl-prolyl isomerase
MKLGLDKDPSYREKFAKPEGVSPGARRLEMARRVFNTQIAAHIDVRYQDGKNYYDKNAELIATELHLEMVRFGNRAEAEGALKKLRGGAPFESIARPVMGDTPVDGRVPWDLGFVKWDKIPVDFADSVYSLKPGEVSDILGSGQTGFQIVKLRASRKLPKVEYPLISATVMNRLRDLKLLGAYTLYVEQLRKNATIAKL